MAVGKLNMREEPALTAGTITATTITAGVVAGMTLAEAFSLYDFTAAQYAAVTGFVVAVWAILIPLMAWVRSVAFAPATVSEIIEQSQDDKELLLAEDPATPISEEAVKALRAPRPPSVLS